MSFTQLTFTITPLDPGVDILVAQLAEIGYDSFEETEEGVRASIAATNFDKAEIVALDVLSDPGFAVAYTIDDVAEENWNRIWESSYSPVMIAGSVYIRASFHPHDPAAKHEIVIDPKMSFGTAHHETTAQMVEQMLVEDFGGKRVLDMGCGTAVLAILAAMLGAPEVVAIDNDKNAVENARENIRKNNFGRINVLLGAADEISGLFDVVLANINKNILIRDMQTYALHMRNKGVVLFSGFYQTDLGDIKTHAAAAGLEFDRSATKNNWIIARFIKQDGPEHND
jgi:ribosomal protein L11 methyltransferase